MTSDQLTVLLEALKTDIVNSLQANEISSPGQTAKQFSITTNGNSAQLQRPGFIQLPETGRWPTGSNAVPGDQPMIQRIQQWCREKSIPDKAARAIKKSIDKNGYKGKPGLLPEPLSDNNINRRITPVMESIATILSNHFLDGLN